MIELDHLTVGYGRAAILSEVCLSFRPGEVLILLGPNGCGKSTLLRTAAGLQPKLGGEVLVDAQPIERLSNRQLAQRVAYLAQSRNIPDITAQRMVLHGRFPYLSYPRRYREEDYQAVEQALQWVDGKELAGRPMKELSGGQRQKIYLAMALAQDTPTILMDEPTTFLDVGRQLEVMALAQRLAREGKAVAMVLHDLCMALHWADRVAVLDGGRILLHETPERIYRSGILERVFGVTVSRIQSEDGWQYYIASGR